MRRRELLARLGVDFGVAPSDVDEAPFGGERAPALAARLAAAKARAAPGAGPVLAADTVVAVNQAILGKPADATEAARMLQRLAGREHEVVTAVALRSGTDVDIDTACTRVWFRPVPDAERDAYAAGSEPLDAAGGYAIQGAAAAFVTRVVGSYTNVVGLPLGTTARLLARAGLLP